MIPVPKKMPLVIFCRRIGLSYPPLIKIELTHIAHNRKGFASGAVLAAQWLKGKKGAYTMEDVLGFNK